MERKNFHEWFNIRESLGAAPDPGDKEALSPEAQDAVDKLKMLLQGADPQVVRSVLSDPMKIMQKYQLDPQTAQIVMQAVQDELGDDDMPQEANDMRTLLTATDVGHKWRDVTGGISTIVHLDHERMIIRRGGRGWPTFSVCGPDGRNNYGNYRTLAQAMKAPIG